jgi:4-amino-4-deoxy-L-arabinose transferase-like glycosyltransferase
LILLFSDFNHIKAEEGGRGELSQPQKRFDHQFQRNQEKKRNSSLWWWWVVVVVVVVVVCKPILVFSLGFDQAEQKRLSRKHKWV